MGLLNLFRWKKEPSNDYGLSELKRQENLGDQELEELTKAAELSLPERIKVYERILPTAHFNAFNHKLSLASMYLEAGEMDKAWGYLNRLYQDGMKSPHFAAEAPKIRKLQFSVLKAEGKYAQALEMLLCSFVLYGNYSQSAIKKDFLPIAKKAGLSKEQTDNLIGALDSALASKQDEGSFLRSVRSIIG